MLCFRILNMVCVFKHLHCSVQLSMSNMEKRYRNKTIIIINGSLNSVDRSIDRSIIQSVNRSIDQFIIHSVNQSLSRHDLCFIDKGNGLLNAISQLLLKTHIHGHTLLIIKHFPLQTYAHVEKTSNHSCGPPLMQNERNDLCPQPPV